ncbi:MAG: response regulator [Crocinitomicaceae bacterium]
MSKRFSFEFKITGILLIVLGLVAMTGIFAYQRFTGIVTEISENLRPDMRLLTAKALINNINDAEISVKSYRITEDTLYLTDFYESVQLADEKLNELHELSKNESDRHLRLDELDTLISQKVRGLNELLLLQDGFRTQQALDKVVDKIEKSSQNEKLDTTSVAENQVEEKRRLFGWLFKKRVKDTVPKVDSIIVEPDLNMDQINKEVTEVKREEYKIQEALKQKELDFITNDQFITKKIMAFFDEFEASELNEIARQSDNAELAIQKTNRQIAWFCVITGVLVVLMAFIIINYVRNNNKYRRALKVSKREAEELARTKQKFLANMSHEIRTPMNAIAGFSEQIGQGPLTETQRSQLGMVQKSTDHLLYLINEVLDLSKLQAQKIKLEQIGFEPKKMMEDIAVFLQNEASPKPINTICETHDSVPDILIGDPFRLQQILFNLLSNAVKFTDQGTISVKTSTLMKTNNECVLRITVEDTGIGMEKKHLKKVFLEFEQAERSTSRNFGGTGLGLSIVKLLVDLHKGNIKLDSEPRKGTAVTFEIPYKIGVKSDLPKKEKFTQVNYKQLENLTVLIADDEKYNRLLLISILKKLNIKYTEAENGGEAVAELKENDYDLILMDIRMPKLDGIKATKKIRKFKNKKKANTPIIALTAAVSEEDKMKYYKAGMNGFLAKPYKEKELLTTIKSSLQFQTKTKEKMSNENEIESLDLKELKNLAAGDQEFYLDMLQTFIEGTEEGVKKIAACLTQSDWENMAEYAHKIASPCKHIGAINLHKDLKEIEKICRDNGDTSRIQDIFDNVEANAALAIKEVQEEIDQQ